MMAKPISVQLYSVREACAKDFPGTLKKIADIGYAGVETAGLHGMKPADVAKLVSELGMKISSTHTSLATKENLSEMVEVHQALGCTAAISGFGPDDFKTPDKVKASTDRLRQSSELLKPHGIRFGMHNHWWEFAEKLEGRYVFDIILEGAPDLFSELDTYWAALGKADPAQVIRTHKKRMPLLHIKDGTLEQGTKHLAVGSGVLDWPGIINAADPSVLEWLVVELDECATDMMEAVKQSYVYLTGNGLAVGRK